MNKKNILMLVLLALSIFSFDMQRREYTKAPVASYELVPGEPSRVLIYSSGKESIIVGGEEHIIEEGEFSHMGSFLGILSLLGIIFVAYRS